MSESETEKRLADYIQNQPWTSDVDLPEFGLKRLHDARGGRGYLTYVPIGADTKNPSVSKPIFVTTQVKMLCKNNWLETGEQWHKLATT